MFAFRYYTLQWMTRKVENYLQRDGTPLRMSGWYFPLFMSQLLKVQQNFTT